jgi:hypothetical protein
VTSLATLFLFTDLRGSSVLRSSYAASCIESEPGESRLVASNESLAGKTVMFVGVKRLSRLGYEDIRKFAQDALEALASSLPQTRQVTFTLHGAGFGLDKVEAFEAELAGLIDSITSDNIPERLEQVTIVERAYKRVDRMQEALPSLLPHGFVEVGLQTYLKGLGNEAAETYRSVGYASADKPSIFVAMPFAEEMDDRYHYGIQGAVKGARFLCERADQAVFTGDVMEWVKQRIESSKLLIAELPNAKANVYLEVGYAWERKKPTVLLLHESEEKRFDVIGQRS